MCTINQLRELCKRFEDENIHLLELQNRLNTLSALYSNSPSLNQLLINLDNEIEEIIFTKLDNNYRKYGLQAIQNFIYKLNGLEK